MGTVILHIGMSKTGSSSIQRWLGENVSLLREHGIDPYRARKKGAGPVVVVPAEPGRARSQPILDARDSEERVAALRQLVDQVDQQAAGHDLIVLTNEGFALLFQSDDERLRTELESLARVHHVRVVCYVRPQHTWLEAAWRQWGFRHSQRPSNWLRRQEPKIRYLRTLRRARIEAPSVSFEMRPFRHDLLEGGEVVSDFAAVLGLDNAPPLQADDGWSNRGFPLDLSILLRGAPRGLFWSSLHDNVTLDRMKEIVLTWQVPESDSVARSRVVLQQYCSDTYEPENGALIDDLGWPTTNFVPPVADDAKTAVGGNLEQIDDLWSSSASEGERQLLYCVLQELLAETH